MTKFSIKEFIKNLTEDSSEEELLFQQCKRLKRLIADRDAALENIKKLDREISQLIDQQLKPLEDSAKKMEAIDLEDLNGLGMTFHGCKFLVKGHNLNWSTHCLEAELLLKLSALSTENKD
jgi:predicted nuclease with TOPRIM domain